MAKIHQNSKNWRDEYASWLKLAKDCKECPDPGESSADYWCIVCKTNVKPKKYNIQLHAKTQKHIKNVGFDEENPHFIVLKDDEGKGESADRTFSVQSVEDSGDKIKRIVVQYSPMEEEIKTEVEDFVHEDPSSSESMDKLLDEVVCCFREDLEAYLKKNLSILWSVRSKGNVLEGTEGVSRLTRILVGHMAQEYLMDYTIDSWKAGRGFEPSNFVTNRLNSVEQTIRKSVADVREMKRKLETEEPEQMSIVIGGMNVEL